MGDSSPLPISNGQAVIWVVTSEGGQTRRSSTPQNSSATASAGLVPPFSSSLMSSGGAPSKSLSGRTGSGSGSAASGAGGGNDFDGPPAPSTTLQSDSEAGGVGMGSEGFDRTLSSNGTQTPAQSQQPQQTPGHERDPDSESIGDQIGPLRSFSDYRHQNMIGRHGAARAA